MAERFVVVVDEPKLVHRLGDFGVPLEVLDFAPEVVAGWVRDLGAEVVERRPDPSDSGNPLMLAHFGPIENPAAPVELSGLPGLVDHGLSRAPW